ncbi:DUF1800 domain-containing protein [Amycolatopsis albispora]|uniref:DUF1800 domain-containing protein n=1 Tax=Amycolatopsis albispora TaxID=1804986 RepID=A0A344KZG3_9PSEU|nr:DUF1800 domain-containing protein [Amycolatopsis albispora]AXB41187.1 hypothetical protein A4R43_00555 [Amycolatopsis albispora]
MAVLDERAAARRLADRFGFGPRPGEPLPALDQLLAPGGPRQLPQLDAPSSDQKARAEQERRLVIWWLDRMVTDDTERLTWFWHGHFATSEQKVRDPALMLAQNETFHRLGKGGFTELAKALVTDAAMLKWLDGNDNKVGSPNENLAREFLELFALGVGHYSEQDVREAARALTGWTLDRKTGEAKLNPKRQDRAPKQIFGQPGDFTAESFVDLVLARPESAAFVTGRLWYRLVSPNPPPADAHQRVIAAYRPGSDVRAALRAIAGEPAFRDPAATIVKQPVEWLVGLLRATGLKASDLDAKKLLNGLRGMGQLPFRPPSVGGWPAGGAWLTTSAGVARMNLAQLVAQKAKDDALARLRETLAMDTWSDRTRKALDGVAKDPRKLLAVAACAPEYVVSG